VALTSQSITVGATAYTGLTVNLGLLFNVTQIAAYNGSTTQNVYLVQCAEQYFNPVSCRAQYLPALAADVTSVNICAVPLQYDSVSNGWLIVLTDLAGSVLNNVAAGEINFECWAINTVSPGSD
jgi:hypothetical protein